MRRTRRISKCLLLIVLITSSILTMPVYASQAYVTYTYNNSGDITPEPDIYIAENVIYGTNLGVNSFSNPQDMFVAANECIYMLDTGNNRVVILNKDLTFKKEINKFMYQGVETSLSEAEGIFVDIDNHVFVCDTGNHRVLKMNEEGNVLYVISKETCDFMKHDIDFNPNKIISDTVGNLYIQSLGTYQGLILLDKNFNYQGFYGSELVTNTSEAVSSYFWKKFMTQEQRDAMSKYVPTEIGQIFIDHQDFIYAITNSYYIPNEDQKLKMDSIRILNPKGKNISNMDISDGAGNAFSKDAEYLNFVDICSDEEGFISIIDNSKGKIYHFDSQMNLIGAFGAYGDYLGTFSKPTAMISVNQKLLVLDANANSVTVFALTEYGKTIHKAVSLYNQGNYDMAISPWEEVLQLNANCELAYMGIGKILLNSQDYKEAMGYFTKANSSKYYNQAFKEYRVSLVRENFLGGLLLFIGTAFLLMMVLKFIKKRQMAKIKNMYISPGSSYVAPITLKKYQYPLYCMRSPDKGFEALKSRKLLSFPVSVTIFFLWIVMEIISFQFMGKQFAIHEVGDFNLISLLFYCFGAIFIWTLSNWCFSVLMEGKATFSDIWCISLYAICPYILSGYINVILYNILTQEEQVFIILVSTAGIIWSIVLLVVAISNFHEFEISNVIGSILLTLLGMVIILVLMFLMYNLFQQLISNIMIFVNEIILRTRIVN